MSNAALNRGRKQTVKELLETERKLKIIVSTSMARIMRIVNKNDNQWNTTVTKEITEQVSDMNARIAVIADATDKGVQALIAATILDSSRSAVAKTIKKSNVIDLMKHVKRPKLSSDLHNTSKWVMRDVLKQLRTSVQKGDSVVKLANKLLKIDLTKVNIPNYIKEIERAARAALQNPADYRFFKRVLKKHERYIENLTRAGEPGFQHLGIRRATKRFIEDIKKANIQNIDSVLNKWASSKALNQQKVTARTEINNAYHEYNFEYAKQADHIIGIRVFLSQSHPEDDECDPFAREYLFATDGTDIPLPSYHPNCMCGFEYIIDPALSPGELDKAA